MYVKRNVLFVLCILLLAACSENDPAQATKDKESEPAAETPATEDTTETEPELTPVEKVREENDQYVNDLLDMNLVFIEIHKEAMSYADTYAPGDINIDSPELEELQSIMSRVESEVVPAFEELGPPPTDDLDRLYEVQQENVANMQQIAENLPLAITGAGRAKNAIGQSGELYEEHSDLIVNILDRLREQGLIE
ncbi:hypothetical protein [Halobacillus sp. Marseille-Q1614]|uniref:hypothetical protein n=1 Tax=Halobacillus sp. Marseille-Q1614 TaxID=2709134 RepID=UPI00156DEF72|nr:hypothetical protein [Halobacillus sp. Marseille-Q1614]